MKEQWQYDWKDNSKCITKKSHTFSFLMRYWNIYVFIDRNGQTWTIDFRFTPIKTPLIWMIPYVRPFDNRQNKWRLRNDGTSGPCVIQELLNKQLIYLISHFPWRCLRSGVKRISKKGLKDEYPIEKPLEKDVHCTHSCFIHARVWYSIHKIKTRSVYTRNGWSFKNGILHVK